MVDENEFEPAAGNGFVHGPCRTIFKESRRDMLQVAQSPKSSGTNLNWHSLSPGKP